MAKDVFHVRDILSMKHDGFTHEMSNCSNGRGKPVYKTRGKSQPIQKENQHKSDEEETEEEEDPFFTDDDREKDKDFVLSDEENNKKSRTDLQSKNVKSSKSAPKRKKSKSSNKEEKMKLAEIIKSEQVIYNLNHKHHSNIHAVSAAWERVSVKMGKSGMQ